MGLLDAMYNGNTYAGDGNSLLDFLRNAQMQQDQYKPTAPGNSPWPESPSAPPQPAGPIAVGDYQMPRMGSMAQFTPSPAEPAAIPQNAQPAQGQLPMQPVQPPQSFGGNALTGLQSFLNGGGLISSIRGAMEGKRADPRGLAQEQENQTAQFLVSKGMDPAMAKTVVADPALARAVIPQIMGMGGSTDDIKEYQFAKKEDPTLTFAKFMQQKKAVSGEYSLTPQYGTNEKGETVLMQTGKSGEAIQTKLPPGIKVSSGVERIDAGTHWILYDKRTGTPVGTQPKDVAGKASQEAQGEAQGKAIVALPTVISTTEQSLKLVDEMIKHPGRETATGLSGTIDPRNYFGGTDAKDFQVRAKQIEGRTFLSAFDQLRGAGAITEAEGQKATAAIARLDRSQSDTEYLSALHELKGVLSRGMEIARQRAGQGGQAPAAPQPNASLKAKYGLD